VVETSGFLKEGDMDWKYLFTNYEGRIGRKQWWTGVLILIVVAILVRLVLGEGGLIQFVIGVLMLLAGLALHIKRCHDRGKSGWWCLLLLIPLVNIIWALIDLGILEGQREDNQWGPPAVTA
jgi:uncharacterized membrane protein YhaH (DUF805 family)